MHYVLFHPHAELAQLRKGLYHTLQFEILTIQYSKEIRGVLAASDLFDVSPNYLCDAFEVDYSPNGSNKRTKEEAIVYFWSEYIMECAQGGGVTLKDILKFLTGSGKVPATGFDATPRIEFFNDDIFVEERLPTISTCTLCLRFSRLMGLLTYEDFKERMTLSILGSHGYGNV